MCNVGSSTTIQLQLLYFSDDFVFHYESFQRLFIHSRSYQVDLFAPFTKIGSSKECQPAAWGFSLLRRSSQPAPITEKNSSFLLAVSIRSRRLPSVEPYSIILVKQRRSSAILHLFRSLKRNAARTLRGIKKLLLSYCCSSDRRVSSNQNPIFIASCQKSSFANCV